MKQDEKNNRAENHAEQEKSVEGFEPNEQELNDSSESNVDNFNEKKENTAAAQSRDEFDFAESDRESELKKLEDEITELKSSKLRLMAEFDNYKRRTQKEKNRIYQDAVVDLVSEWLPLLDNLDRASDAVNALQEDDDIVKYKEAVDGIVQITKLGKKILQDQGVEEIAALNQKFDPNLHEAVLREDSEDYDVETVTEVFAKGYIYKDKVIRHSVVKVAN